jgi:hypothetical protein
MVIRSHFRIFLSLFLALYVATFSFAQDPPRSTTNSDLKELIVTVTNSKRELVMGLEKDSFALTDEGTSRPIKLFDKKDEPVSLGILIDTSASMALFI